MYNNPENHNDGDEFKKKGGKKLYIYIQEEKKKWGKYQWIKLSKKGSFQ